MSNGDRLSGTVIDRTIDQVILEHDVFGRIDVPIASIREVRTSRVLFPTKPQPPEGKPLPIVLITPPGDPTSDDTAEISDPPPPPPPVVEVRDVRGPDRAEEDTKPEATWRSHIELGVVASEGNTQNVRLRSSFRTSRSSPTNEFRYDATYRLTSERGDRTENRFTTGAFSEWPFRENRWSYFAQGRYDFAEFQSWDHRITAGGGLSFKLFDLQREREEGRHVDYFQLRLRGGAGFKREIGSLDDMFEPEGIFGFEMFWNINEWMRFEAGSTAFPTLDHLEDYRVVSNADWIIDINRLEGISLKLGAAHEFQSETSPGVSSHDLTAYATLVISF